MKRFILSFIVYRAYFSSGLGCDRPSPTNNGNHKQEVKTYRVVLLPKSSLISKRRAAFNLTLKAPQRYCLPLPVSSIGSISRSGTGYTKETP